MKARPTGLECLLPWSHDITDDVDGPRIREALDLPWVRGLVVRFRWSDDFYNSSGALTWAKLDRTLDYCRAANRFVHLMVAPGVYSPPDVLAASECVDLPVPQGGFEGPQPLPLPWDTTYLARWLDFVTELGARCDSNATVRCVSVTGPNGHNGEVNLPHQGEPGFSKRQIEDTWLSLVDGGGGSTQLDRVVAFTDLWLDAWKRCFRGFRRAFPTTFKTVGILYRPVPLHLTIRDLKSSSDDTVAATAERVQRRFKRRLLTRGVLADPSHFGVQTNGLDDSDASQNAHWQAIARRGRRGSLTGYQVRHSSNLTGDYPKAQWGTVWETVVNNFLHLRGEFLQVYVAQLLAEDDRRAALIRAQAALGAYG